MTWPEGRTAVDYLLSKNRLETIDSASAASAASAILGRATVRLATAKGGLEVGDESGAYAVAYDSFAWLRKPCWRARVCARPAVKARI